MHNGYGSGDVDIFFSTVLDGYKPINYEGATAVTVAGRDGTYHRKDGRFNLQEEWIVDIEGTRIGVRIRLEAPMDTSQADLVEAHAIIDSIRSEPMDNDLGFRLLFTLSTDDWDSG
jgi:hypothetical protein